ncbi:MAG: signal recognition particle-docking protein FtsY [Desulfobulbaceae bacterium]|nr:signal recognition particle-docking protein FtsY [Desulfobulbaceae bacterium]HIJ77846.1 signal recognition particle-docking protein FtsY [Deltaproteobacteria bacterium]
MLGWFKKKFESRPEEEQGPGGQTVAEPQAMVANGEAAESSDVDSAPPVAVVAEQLGQPSAPASEFAADNKEPEAGLKFFKRLKERLAKTHDSFVARVDELFLGKKVIDQELFDELEEILIMADLGVGVTREILDRSRAKVKRKELCEPLALKKAIKEQILAYLQQTDRPADLVMPRQGPFVIMVLGVNGVGKTTTIGKLAYKFRQAGQNVLLVAADTFRAAASEQLQIWGQRIGVEVFTRPAGADPSSVVFDGLEYANARNFDVIIVDTAGRLHTQVNLMEELKKIKRVMGKKIENAPHETMLVIDATTGQNGISQARLFNEGVELTGLALTKLDGTAKGGIVVNICHEFNIPIRFIGIGEQMEDLRDFNPQDFIDALFANDHE